MHVVVIGGGIQGAAVAYFLAEKHGDQQQQKQQSAQPTSTTPNTTTLRITVLEAVAPAAAASGKGGGFMGRSWGGDGSPTQRLHELSFDLYDQLASKHASSITSYRKLPVLSVAPSSSNTKNNLLDQAQQDQTLKSILPSWLDGSVGRIRVMGHGDDTAQVTPVEVVHTMLSAHPDIVSTVLGRCVGIESAALPPMAPDTPPGHRQVTGVRYVPTTSQESAVPNGHDDPEAPEILLPADVVVVCAGPWSCMAETWFGTSESPLELPMEGIKSTSIVWKSPSNDNGETQGGAVDPTALFCGEDGRYGTHCKCKMENRLAKSVLFVRRILALPLILT